MSVGSFRRKSVTVLPDLNIEKRLEANSADSPRGSKRKNPDTELRVDVLQDLYP